MLTSSFLASHKLFTSIQTLDGPTTWRSLKGGQTKADDSVSCIGSPQVPQARQDERDRRMFWELMYSLCLAVIFTAYDAYAIARPASYSLSLTLFA